MNGALNILRKVALAWALSVFVVLPTLAQSTLVPTGSVWNYLNDGSDQGTTWRETNFDDRTWPIGSAELGFGEGDESTVIGSMANGFITFYFRQAFTVVDPSSVTNLAVFLKRDDGAIVYLNNTEVFRSNMPGGAVDYLTGATVATADDGKDIFTNAVDAALLVSGVNVLAVEVHQNTNTSSDISFDLALVGNVLPVPPAVSLVHPTDGDAIFSSNVTLNATAVDADGTITLVEFFVNGTKAAEDDSPPYSAFWSGVEHGSYTLTVVAHDSQGLSATSAPVRVTVVTPTSTLIERGAVWKYLDDGSDQGLNWTAPTFDDSHWGSGRAQLGYGDGDEATLVNGGPGIITTYFRHRFLVSDRSAYSNLVVRVLRDDGVVVYLNGAEVFRNNMPTGAATYLTTAAAAIEDEHLYATNIDLSLLRDGENMLAVELHQASSTSSDISFDLELRPNVPPTRPEVSLIGPTTVAFIAPANFVIVATASDLDDPVNHVEFYVGDSLVHRDFPAPDSIFSAEVSNLAIGTYVLRVVAEDNSALRGTSAPVRIDVVSGPVITSLIATGSVWKYLDTGVSAGMSWKEPSFDDSAWRAGPAELGYGDSADSRPEATLLRFGPNSMSKYITYYFRHDFWASRVSSFTDLIFHVLRDDGAVVYLNGTEIFRMNMPATGPITFQTRASSPVGMDETTYYPVTISPDLLAEGRNLLAVEIHQSTPDSSDVSFDLKLDALSPPSSGPSLRIERTDSPSPGIVLRWTEPNAVLQQTDTIAEGWSDVPSNPQSPYAVQPTAVAKFYRLRQ